MGFANIASELKCRDRGPCWVEEKADEEGGLLSHSHVGFWAQTPLQVPSPMLCQSQPERA